MTSPFEGTAGLTVLAVAIALILAAVLAMTFRGEPREGVYAGEEAQQAAEQAI
jgi:FlaG/FlaF family flagellin (archaellin)